MVNDVCWGVLRLGCFFHLYTSRVYEDQSTGLRKAKASRISIQNVSDFEEGKEWKFEDFVPRARTDHSSRDSWMHPLLHRVLLLSRTYLSTKTLLS
jgi:hypothetical protein